MLKRSDIPNAICMLRVLMVAPTIWALLDGRYALAVVLVFAAGLSDGLDGYLAKRFNWRTRLGGMLDPLADKLLLVSLFLTLAWLGFIPGWLAVVVIGRDLVIVAGGTAYNFLIGPVQPDPTRASKLNTLAQLLCVVSVLVERASGWPVAPAITATGAAVLVTSVVSGLDYVIRWTIKAASASASRTSAQ